jgi:hypothetical protein
MVTLAQRRLGTDAKVVYPEEDYFVTSPYTGTTPSMGRPCS